MVSHLPTPTPRRAAAPAPSPPSPPLFDRDTAIGVVVGGALGAKGFPFWMALGLTAAWSAAVVVAARLDQKLVPVAVPSGPARFVVDTATAMAGWYAGRAAFPPPARSSAR